MKENPAWTGERVLETVRQYQVPAVLMAAAELDLFTWLKDGPKNAADLAKTRNCNERALGILLNALAATDLVCKGDNGYSLGPRLSEFLTEGGPETVVEMIRHQANCFRNWGELARVVQTGCAAEPRPGVRGDQADLESFIDAMHNVSAPVAGEVIRAIHPLEFKRVLDIGGGPGTWTMAFLRACPTGTAVLFDLPQVIPLARKRIEQAGLAAKVEFVEGDYLENALPEGCDLAWLSAIVHQNSLDEVQTLFQKVHAALEPGGRIAIRDIVMEEDRVNPPAGALFAVNMLAGTEAGGTFTYSEMETRLRQAGFQDIHLARRDPGMHSIIVAKKA